MTERTDADGGCSPGPAAVGRRDFLLLRTRGPERVLELSCERLYMRWADARSGAGRVAGDDPPAATAGLSGGQGSPLQPWDGEPPTEIERTGVQELFGRLERSLADVETLRLVDREWMHDPVFASELRARVEPFLARGGSVE